MIDQSLQRLLGLLGDEKRVYRFIEGEVTREEFEHCQLLDQVVFGPKGLVESLGPTWAMIHDPRFNLLEAKFIVKRRSLFGGDTTQGVQYIDSNGNFTSSISDLEQYSDILGEGRNFYVFLQHPEKECPERVWLERTWKASKWQAGPDIICLCNPDEKLDPFTWKNQPDETIWALIRREWPNYFRGKAKDVSGRTVMQVEVHTPDEYFVDINHPDPRYRFRLVNIEGSRLFNLSKADLVGLVAQYAYTPNADDWTSVDSDDAANANDKGAEAYKVAMEVDFLDKALTFRASLRATAAKILDQIGFTKHLKNLGTPRLTDSEADTLLRMVYRSDYPNDKVLLVNNLLVYVQKLAEIPYKDRLKDQLATATDNAQLTLTGLKSGTVKPVNQLTDAEPEDVRSIEERFAGYQKQMIEWSETPEEFSAWKENYEASLVQASLFKNPLKKDLFLLRNEAQERAYDDWHDFERRQVVDPVAMEVFNLLDPLFANAYVLVGEKEYAEIMTQVKATGYFKKAVKAFEEEFHTKDSCFRGGTELDPETLKPLDDLRSLDDVWEDSLKKIKPKGNA